MSFKIFYAWQSDTNNEYNWRFIGECIEEAIKRLKKKYKDESPNFIYSRDTKGVPGWPNIPETVYKKIDECDVFIGDLSVIGYIPGEPPKPQLNSNVVGELNYALARVTEERIINVMNVVYGKPGETDVIPFDFAQRRFPIQFNLSDENVKEVDSVKEKLTANLYDAIKAIFDTEHERQKKEYEPFETWKSWDSSLEKRFRFESNAYIENLFKEIRVQASSPKTSTRVLGLSGLGKTRLLLECFSPENGAPAELTNSILYVNLNDVIEEEVLKKCKELFRNKANKTVILDNCGVQLHTKIQSLFSNNECQLSLITISAEPNESLQEIDPEGRTHVIKLLSREFNDIVSDILKRNFKELENDEIALLVDYSNGLSLFAKLMADNPERARYQPGSLNIKSVIERILGDLYTSEESKAVIQACCLFSKFGFFDDLAFQCEQIAASADLCNLTFPNVRQEDIPELRSRRFKEICKILHDRQLLEKVGRTFSFRPSPLAIKMAEEWWRNCTVEKFQRLIPVIREAHLVESFCEQFRNLKHIDQAQEIVGELCNGVFSLAEVLNSNVGSRLFRSFVDVNPTACAEALVRAFLNLSKLQLTEIKEGRRDLVWALEKLCFREETFDSSVKIMAAFSIGENEDIGNNATNQFLQLFHIFLPGTSVNLERRWNIVEYCLNKDDDYIQLGISALSSCLAVGQFNRLGGAEDQGDVTTLVDYNPSSSEIFEYWKKAINKLSEIIFSKNQYSDRAIKIVLDKFYSITEQGGGVLIIPVIEKIMEENLVDRMDIRKKVQFVLNSKRVFNTAILGELERIFSLLTPNSTLEKFKVYVVNPSSDEYFTSEEGDGYNLLLKKIETLSEEFYENRELWDDLISALVSGNIYEGFNFGKALSKVITTDVEKFDLLLRLISKLIETPKESRNVTVIIGLISGIQNKDLQIEIFNEFLSKEDIRDYSFAIARSIELPFGEINKLLDFAKRGSFSTVQFSNFEYGWGIKHLPYEDVIRFIDSLREIDEKGRTVAYFILIKWTSNNEQIWDIYKGKIEKLILSDSRDIFNTMHGSMDYYYWSDPIIKLLNDNINDQFVEDILKQIIDQCKDFEGFFSKENSFYRVLETIQNKHFDLFWKYVSDVYSNASELGLTAFHFKSILGSRQDAYVNSEGLLFKGDKRKFEIVFNWCKAQSMTVVARVAELLPIYKKDKDDTLIWHPYAKEFIDAFGDSKEVLSYISAKIGTYSWIGSVVPKLEGDLRLFRLLIDHPIENVKVWAELNIKNLERKIKSERDRDEDKVWI
ncbi:MAG: hypothetical protein KGZ74_14305 [Chitinophagaceae bacterium]|nr:hypothetical protein [Chitinophagaceae bacterium]